MGIFDWLFKGPVERSVESAPRARDRPIEQYDVEIAQARVLDGLSPYAAEHVAGWGGPEHNVPYFEYRDASDIWADERIAAQLLKRGG